MVYIFVLIALGCSGFDEVDLGESQPQLESFVYCDVERCRFAYESLIDRMRTMKLKNSHVDEIKLSEELAFLEESPTSSGYVCLQKVRLYQLDDLINKLDSMHQERSAEFFEFMVQCLPDRSPGLGDSLPDESVFKQLMQGSDVLSFVVQMVKADWCREQVMETRSAGAYLQYVAPQMREAGLFKMLELVPDAAELARHSQCKLTVTSLIWKTLKETGVSDLKPLLSYLKFVILDENILHFHAKQEIRYIAECVSILGQKRIAYDFLEAGRSRCAESGQEACYEVARKTLKPSAWDSVVDVIATSGASVGVLAGSGAANMDLETNYAYLWEDPKEYDEEKDAYVYLWERSKDDDEEGEEKDAAVDVIRCDAIKARRAYDALVQERGARVRNKEQAEKVSVGLFGKQKPMSSEQTKSVCFQNFPISEVEVLISLYDKEPWPAELFDFIVSVLPSEAPAIGCESSLKSESLYSQMLFGKNLLQILDQMIRADLERGRLSAKSSTAEYLHYLRPKFLEFCWFQMLEGAHKWCLQDTILTPLIWEELKAKGVRNVGGLLGYLKSVILNPTLKLCFALKEVKITCDFLSDLGSKKIARDFLDKGVERIDTQDAWQKYEYAKRLLVPSSWESLKEMVTYSASDYDELWNVR